MHEFTVWAPRAKKVGLKIGETVESMDGPDDRGWWRKKVEEAGPGTDYSFVLNDGKESFPDPRSPWQPLGVSAPSRLVDHKAFHWDDSTWQGPPLAGAVIYELHIGTFTHEGTFDAAIGRLEYLETLGVTHIEIMPVATFPGNHGWGYDGVSLFAVVDLYGGPDGLKRFVNSCHVHGLGVILDVVYNHFGPVGNFTGLYGPYTTGKHCTPWGEAVNFEDVGSDEVRRFFIDNALMWMRDYHIDGLRMDAVHEFVDRSAVHFMEQMSAEVDTLSATLGRRLILIAESDLNDPRVVTPREAGGYGIDAQWSDDFHHSLFTVLHVEEGKGYYNDFGCFEDLAKSLTDMFVYDGKYSSYRKRSHGRPVDGLSAHHFIGFIQNHDQVGNRATGDRLEHMIGMDKAKVALGLVLTAPFIPMLFMGEEFAASTPFQYFADHDDPVMAKAVSEGRMKEFAAFGWKPEEVADPEKVETFERSKLDWNEIHEDKHGEMLDWVTKLIHLRRSSPSLNDGDVGHAKVRFDEEKRWLKMQRRSVTVFCNLGVEAKSFDVETRYRLVMSSKAEVERKDGTVVLPPDSFAVVSCEGE